MMADLVDTGVAHAERSELYTKSYHINCYAFTIKKLGSYLTPNYSKIIRKFRSYGIIDSYVTEQDSHGKDHIHGVINLPQGFFMKKLQIQGYHVYTKLITDYDGWVAYMNKQNHHSEPKVPDPEEPRDPLSPKLISVKKLFL